MEENKISDEEMKEHIQFIAQEFQKMVEKFEEKNIPPQLTANLLIGHSTCYNWISSPCFHAFLGNLGSSLQNAAQSLAHYEYEDGGSN